MFSAVLLASVAILLPQVANAIAYSGPISGGTIASLTVGSGFSAISLDGVTVTGTVTFNAVDSGATILMKDTTVGGAGIIFTQALSNCVVTLSAVTAVSTAYGLTFAALTSTAVTVSASTVTGTSRGGYFLGIDGRDHVRHNVRVDDDG